jgi:hypothetical protein
MVPTLEWMKVNFDKCNRRYFNDKIPCPKFSLNCPEGYWGYYMPDARYNRITRKMVQINSSGTLYLTSKYSRNEKDVISTLLHEMIHMYIMLVMKKYPLDQHGRDFTQIASVLNRDGWNISSFVYQSEFDTLITENDNDIIYVFVALHNGVKSAWGFKGKEDDINRYIAKYGNLPYQRMILRTYKCELRGIRNLPTSDNRLVQGESISEVMRKISHIIGEHLNNENTKQIREINIK